MPAAPAIEQVDRLARGRAAPAGPASVAEKPLIVAAVVRSAEVEAAMHKALSTLEHVVLRVKLVDEPDLATLHALQGDVIVADIDVSNRQELAVLSEFVAERTSAPVVVTSPWLDVTAMRELMRIGVLDVVPQPLDPAELIAAVTQAAARRPALIAVPQEQRGLVISFLAAHGGCGVTSLAVHGACALAQRRDPPSLCLLDLNIQFGSAALLLDAEQRSSVLDLIHSPERLDGELLRAAMVRAHGRFDLLGSPTTVSSVDDIDPAAIAATIATASREYAVTIIDLPLLWSHWTHASLRASNVIVLAVQLTVPSLRQGRRQLDMLRQEELDDIPLVVVANRVQSGLFSSSGVPLKSAMTALGRKVDYVVPESPAMRAAAEAGVPLSEVSGGRALEKKLVTVMEGVMHAGQSAGAPLREAGD